MSNKRLGKRERQARKAINAIVKANLAAPKPDASSGSLRSSMSAASLKANTHTRGFRAPMQVTHSHRK